MPYELVNLVNPLQGTNSHQQFSNGNCLPFITRAFAMTSWSLQTAAEDGWFFKYNDEKIQGVRASRQPSPWIQDYGHFLLMAQTGQRRLGFQAQASSYRKNESIIKPHYLKTFLWRYQTQLEMTPTERCSFFKLTFPKTKEARLIFQLFEGEGEIQILPGRQEIRGFTRAHVRGQARDTVPENFASYFVLKTNLLFLKNGFCKEGAIYENNQDGSKSISGSNLTAFLEWDLSKKNEPVTIQVGTSFISLEQAELNLKQEIGTRSFDEIKKETEKNWEEELGRFEITGASEKELQTFYTCLYRSLIFPHKFYELNEKGEPFHYSPYNGKICDGVLYEGNGFWDTHRTVYPLLSLLSPTRLCEILEGWVNASKEGGYFPKWPAPGYNACMISTHIDAIFADAYNKGIQNFDVEAAVLALQKNAFETGLEHNKYGRVGLADYIEKGFAPSDTIKHGTSRTLDFAYCDWAIATILRDQSLIAEAEKLEARCFNYKNVFSKEVDFMRGKNEDGSWFKDFNPLDWGGPFVEGSAWQCAWAVPHDIAGLIDLLGGKESFLEKLNELFDSPPYFNPKYYNSEIHEMTEMAAVNFGQYAQSNQPSHHLPYLYAFAGRPEKVQYWVRKAMAELYGPGENDLPGDEDNGEMSAWYILNALGFYPFCLGKAEYIIGSPAFPEIRLKLENGKELKICAKQNSEKNVYVQELKVNGETHKSTVLNHSLLANGATLEFEMGAKAKTDRDFTDEQLPFSFSKK